MNESDRQPSPDQGDFLESEYADDAVIGRAFRWSMLVVLVVCVVLGGYLLWSRFDSPETEAVAEITTPLPEIRELPPVEIPEMRFTDITREAGITFVYENGANGEKLLPETMGGGC
ncbi:MAG: CRTAC1 family protein, partial [Planctomycetes bacterium]|nr:CRTAC1 family protein [Planctomycetota bacterium]